MNETIPLNAPLPSLKPSLSTKFSDVLVHGLLGSRTPMGMPVLVVGASSLAGAHVSRIFHQQNLKVVATEDNVNIATDPISWYRWEKLIGLGLSPQFVNYSNHEMTASLLKKYSPKTIIYIPTILFNDKTFDFSPNNTRLLTEQFENYISLLEIVGKMPTVSSLVLLSHSSQGSTHKSAMKLFELSLLVYRHQYGKDVTIVRTGELYGPWVEPEEVAVKPHRKCFVGHLVMKLEALISQGPANLFESFVCGDIDEEKNQTGLSLTKQWVNEYKDYRDHQTKEVIMSSYITTKRNAQYPIEFVNNNYYFMENWFKNIYKMNLNMMVLHDDLSSHFTSTFKANYPKGDFVKIADFKDYRPNDRRFLGYYDYIIAHPEIKRVLMTDMRDLVIQNNPFEVMEVVGDYAYSGIDRPFKETVAVSDMMYVFRRCFTKNGIDYHREIQLLGFLNAGTIGGSRHVMLAFLTRFLQYFQISNKDNCNMGIIEMLFHKFFFDKTFFGWPINAAFLTEQPNIPGLAVLHKWSMESYN